MQNIKMRIFRLSIVLLSVVSITLGLVNTAHAVEIVSGNTIAAGQVIDDDVFISGDTVVIDGTVNGDLFAVGSNVRVNGVVKGSLVAAGQTIEVNGDVSGSIYAGSSSMILGETAKIGRNVYYGGFGLETKVGSTIGRDLAIGGYQAVLSGNIVRDAFAAVGALHLNGEVGRDVKAEVSTPGQGFEVVPFFNPPGIPAMVAAGLHVGKGAKIGGTLTYTSEARQESAVNSQPAGGIVYQTPVPSKAPEQKPQPTNVVFSVGRWFLARLREFVTLLVLGGFALWLIPNYFTRWVDQAKTQTIPSAGWGFLSLIVGYIGAAMLALSILALAIFLGVITLGGLSGTVFGVGFSTLGLGFAVFSLCVSYGSKLVVTYLAGKLILEKVFPLSSIHKIWPLVLGTVIYILIRSIPFLGWVAGFLATIIGLGAIWLVLREGNRPTIAPPVELVSA
jgi:cytoskeletal protein CcmA (bactofilin family)